MFVVFDVILVNAVIDVVCALGVESGATQIVVEVVGIEEVWGRVFQICKRQCCGVEEVALVREIGIPYEDVG